MVISFVRTFMFFIPYPLQVERLKEKGSVLIGLIVTLTTLAALSAGILVMTNSSTFTPVSGQGARQAYYLAESGYRFGAMQYLMQETEDQKDAVLNELHGKKVQVGSIGSFEIALSSYFFRTSQGVNANAKSLPLNSYGAWPQDLVFPSTGKVQVVAQSGQVYGVYEYTAVAVNSGKRILTLKDNHPSFSEGANVFPVVTLSGSRTLAKDGDLTLPANTGAYFPRKNGIIRIGDVMLGYTERDGNVLKGLRDPYFSDSEGYVSPFGVIPANSLVIPGKFIRYAVTGSTGDGAFSGQRTITYNVPIGYLAALDSGQFVQWHDRMNTPGNWIVPDTSSAIFGWGNLSGVNIRGYDFGNVDGNQAMRMKSADSGSYLLAYASLNYGNTSGGVPDLARTWAANNKSLSYDVQVKLRIPKVDHYASGISFRVDSEGNSYGLSISKTLNMKDAIPNAITPYTEVPYLVLWKQKKVRSCLLIFCRDDLQWEQLAYKELDGELAAFFDDAESGMGNWVVGKTGGLDWGRTYASGGGQCFTDSPGQNYAPNSSTWMTLKDAVDLSGESETYMKFKYYYDIQGTSGGGNNVRWYDYIVVEISNDDGQTWREIARGAGSVNPWQFYKNDLTSQKGSQVKIRFRFESNASIEKGGVCLDDIALVQPTEWPTILVRVNEKIVSETDSLDNSVLLGKRVNDIQVMIADRKGRGTPSINFLDTQRSGHIRDQMQWPALDLADTSAETDYFTLIRWDSSKVSNSVKLAGKGDYLNTVIRDEDKKFLSDSYATYEEFAQNRPELGLHSWGTQSGSTVFDDFGIQLGSGVAGGQAGFLPPIQE